MIEIATVQFPLAYAQAFDPSASNSNLVLVMISMGIIAGVAVAGCVPIFIAWGRRNRHAESILMAVIVWGLALAGCGIYQYSAEVQWSKEQNLQLETGYGNPNDVSGDPALPVVIWIGLGAGYAAIIGWSFLQKNSRPPPTLSGENTEIKPRS